MANGDDPVTLPQLADPKTFFRQFKQPTSAQQVAASKPSPKAAAKGGMFDGLMAALDDIEDPFTQSIVKGAMEARISDRLGFTFHFPNPEEQELQRQQTMRQILQEQQQTEILNVEMAQARFLDYADELGPEKLKLIGIEPGEDPFLTNPDMAIAIGQRLYESGRIPMPVTRGMLRTAKKPINALEATDLGEQRLAAEREEIGKAAAAGEAAKKQAALMAEAGDEESLIGGAIKSVQKRTEAAAPEGIDIESDLDEPRGSELFYDFTERATRDVAAVTGQTEGFIAKALLGGEIGKNIADQLEGLDTNALGELVVGKGDAGVADEATLYLAASVMNLSSKAGVSARDGFGLTGLSYSGVDQESLANAITALAKKRGASEASIIKSFGPGFIEAVSRMESEKRVQRRETKR